MAALQAEGVQTPPCPTQESWQGDGDGAAGDLLPPRESNGRFRQGGEAGAVYFPKSEWFPSLHRKLV